MNTGKTDTRSPEIIVDDGDVRLEDLMAVAFEGRRVRLSDDVAWRDKLQRSRSELEQSLSAGDRIYGVSTGVGHGSSRTIDPEHTHEFAYQIIRQHGCGLGEVFSEAEGRAVIFARLVSLSKGYSAVRLSLLEALCNLLNCGVIPVIPSLGSVGASGDLTPLSYLAAVLAGEREVYYGGEVLAADKVLGRAGLKPHDFVPKESLAIMNGTSVMTAIGSITAARFGRTLDLCERAAGLAAEILLGRSQAFHPTAHRLKHHPGQISAAAAIRSAISGSRLMDSAPEKGRIIQDPYSIRCAPHVIGAARDALTWAGELLIRELNSVNDNPIVDPDVPEIIFAGNFYGGHVALAMDLIKTAAASVADLLDRQYALLVDSRLNSGLPETLVGYEGCGLKALQLTCSALTARAVQRSAPDTVLSRPTEAHNQDKVSMGLHAALNAAEITTLVQQVLATELIALSNAAALRNEEDLSPAGRRLLGRVRDFSPVLENDRRLDRDLERLSRAIDQGLDPVEVDYVSDREKLKNKLA
ncbi:MAG: aromatic amino acid ammonia-lyase [Desulfobacterales bacterium]|nr:aromatic amino acid ammonia-lyase [Desulfobacterales bacterium]